MLTVKVCAYDEPGTGNIAALTIFEANSVEEILRPDGTTWIRTFTEGGERDILLDLNEPTLPKTVYVENQSGRTVQVIRATAPPQT